MTIRVTFTSPTATSQDAADPFLTFRDGWYYFTGTLDRGGGLWVWVCGSGSRVR